MTIRWQMQAPVTPVRVVSDGQSLLTIPVPASIDYAMLGLVNPAAVPTKVGYHTSAFPGMWWEILLDGGTYLGVPVPPASTRTWPWLVDPVVPILNLLGGTSNITVLGQTGAQVYAALQNYATVARTVRPDLKIVAGTIPPAGAITAGAMETARTDHNTLLLANSGGFFDAVYDVASSPLDDCNNTTYYRPDKLHWTATGASVAGAKERTAISSQLPV